MQNEEEATLAPVQTSARTADLPLRRIVLRRATVNVSAIRALGFDVRNFPDCFQRFPRNYNENEAGNSLFCVIIQLIVAVLTFSFGIVVVIHGDDADRFDNTMTIGILGIVGGVIIFVAGALGIISYKDGNNQSKTAFHLAFSIMACCVSIVGIYFDALVIAGFDVMECNDDDFRKPSYVACRAPGRALVGLLLCLAITEFLVALIASVFTCIFSCCGGNNCCDGSHQDIIRDSEDREYIFTSRNEQTVATLISRQESRSGHIPSEENNINQGLAQANATMPSYGATNITHVNHASPPPYEENESFVAN